MVWCYQSVSLQTRLSVVNGCAFSASQLFGPVFIISGYSCTRVVIPVVKCAALANLSGVIRSLGGAKYAGQP